MIYIKITIVYFKERQNYKYDMYTEFTLYISLDNEDFQFFFFINNYNSFRISIEFNVLV